MLPENQTTHYALVKLEEAARVITQAVSEMPPLRARLEKYKDSQDKARELYGDLQRQRDKVAEALDIAALSLLEMEEQAMVDYTIKLGQSVRAFNLMTSDYTKLCATLSGYLSQLPVSEQPEAKTTNNRIIARLMNHVRLGYYPTEMEHAKMIRRGIEFPDGVTTNLFDPACGCGLALHELSRGQDCATYGIELDRHRAEESLTRLNRVGFGSYFHSRVSHESFHAMLLNPPYLSVMTEGGNRTRSEKRFLVDSLCHLMYGGLIIYIVPYYRLTADICRVLCDNLDDITVWRFTGEEFKRFRQVAVLGTRCKRRDGSDMVQALSSLAMNPGAIPELTELTEHRYALPTVTKLVDVFKGSEFNQHELSEQLAKSNSFSRLFAKNKLDSDIKRPLLPLNIGQIGLVGGSGLINGRVECDTPHIIKDRIVKENTVRVEETVNNRGEVTATTMFEVRSNKMIFNLLTPQGFRSLA